MNEQVIPAGAQVVRMQPSEDFNKLIQELTQLKKDIDLYLQGMEEVRDENGNISVIQKVPRMINEKGRREVMAWVQTYINPNLYLAENEKANVMANYELDKENLLDALFKNLNEFELTIDAACAIHSKCCNMMFHALQRSTSDKKYIFNTINTNYSQQPQQEPQKKMWGLF